MTKITDTIKMIQTTAFLYQQDIETTRVKCREFIECIHSIDINTIKRLMEHTNGFNTPVSSEDKLDN